MADLISEVADDKAKNQSGPPSLKIKDGASAKVRVLPGTFGKTGSKWFVETTEHWLDTPEGKARPFLCAKHQYGEECPACVAWDEAAKMVDALESDLDSCTDKDELAKLNHRIEKYKVLKKKFAFRKAYLMNVLNRADQTPTVLVYTAPKTVWEQFCNEWLNAAKEEDINILDAKEGYDFTVSRTTENKMTKYSVTTAKKVSAVAADPADLKAILAKRFNLEDTTTFLARPKKAKMEEAIAHIGKLAATVRQRPVDTEGDYEAPAGKGKKPAAEEEEAPRKRRVIEEEEEAPRKRRVAEEEEEAPRPKKRVVEDDGDEAPVPAKKRPTDEEEDEGPTSRAKALGSRFARLDDDD